MANNVNILERARRKFKKAVRQITRAAGGRAAEEAFDKMFGKIGEEPPLPVPPLLRRRLPSSKKKTKAFDPDGQAILNRG